MDKLSIISVTLFLAAGLFAVTSLAMPDWIVTEAGHQHSIHHQQKKDLFIVVPD